MASDQRLRAERWIILVLALVAWVLASLSSLAQADIRDAESVVIPTDSGQPIDFGRYHALLIGNNEHRELPYLVTPISDVRALALVLRSRYGFQVEVLTNATRGVMLTALNKYRSQLTENDNFLLYYAGHGSLDRANDRGHWLPVDASPTDSLNWIANTQVTDMITAMDAKHVMVIADSDYAGALTRSRTVASMPSSAEGDLRTSAPQERWLRLMARSRSRTVLASGGLRPVLRDDGSGHSLFANHLLQVLVGNDRILEGSRLLRELAPRVRAGAAQLGFEQAPEYSPIRFAGDVGAPFFFVPVD